MAEKIPPRFRKTKTDKWAVMAPVEDLEKALAEGGKIEVQKKSGDWSSFRVASLGKAFDVDGVQMCYGYGPEEEGEGATGGGQSGAQGRGGQGRGGQGGGQTAGRGRSGGGAGSGGQQGGSTRDIDLSGSPANDPSEPMPEYQGGAEDEWAEF